MLSDLRSKDLFCEGIVLNIGEKKNRLTVIGEVFYEKKRPKVECICDCGKTKTVRYDELKQGRLISCGCFRLEKLREKLTKHSKTQSNIYSTWEGMLQRCNNPKNVSFCNYGGRGISVCTEWFDFKNFYHDMGDKPVGMSLDRVDNDKGYFKENCRWATPSTQGFNTRISKNNTSGCKGVSWRSEKGKWEAYITKNRKKINLGTFTNYEHAVSARKDAEKIYIGDEE